MEAQHADTIEKGYSNFWELIFKSDLIPLCPQYATNE